MGKNRVYFVGLHGKEEGAGSEKKGEITNSVPGVGREGRDWRPMKKCNPS